MLRDADVSARHFEIIIDGGEWRAQTYSPEQRIVIDRRWAHPKTGKKGALIYAGGTEILLFPGDLDEAAVQGEIEHRANDDVSVRDAPDSEERTVRGPPTAVPKPTTIRVLNRPSYADEVAGARATNIEDDAIDLGMLPTLAGDQVPPELAEVAASIRARSDDPLVAPSVRQPPDDEGQTVDIDFAGGAAQFDPAETATASGGPNVWEQASPRRPKRVPSLPPELVAEPESRMAPMPGAERSVFASVADSQAWEGGTVPTKRPTNAWGDPSPEAFDPSRALPPPRKTPAVRSTPPGPRSTPPGGRSTNAWGDASPRSSRQFKALSEEEVRHHASTPPRAGGRSAREMERQPEEGTNGSPSPIMSLGRQLTSRDLMALAHDPALTIVREPDGDYATSIRLLGTRLEELVRTFGYRAYMLTSAEPLTGKTTAACNLALALAEDPVRRIALIEANFRHPRLGDILDSTRAQGLIGVLSGQIDVSEAIIKIADRNLIIFPSGGRHPNPAELLASPRFKTLLAELADTVDVAIIDAPSVKPFADTNLLLPLVDAALLVVLEGATKGVAISQAIEQLGADRVLGALFNRVDKKLLEVLASSRDERVESGKGR